MLKMNELEKKWVYYKLKNFLVSAVGLSFTILVMLLAYYFYITKIKNSSTPTNTYLTNVLGVTQKVEQEDKIKKVASLKPIEELKKIETKVETLSETKLTEVSLEPIIPVIDMEKEESIRYAKKTYVKRSSSNVEPTSKLVKAKANSYLTAKELTQISKVKSVPTIQPHITKKMKFQTTSVNYIETMKKKFSLSKKSRDAVLISKAFYKKGNYDEAEKWALSANKIDANLDESWLIFAKSKAKLGKKQEAINILASYYQKSKSVKAKLLIGQIKAGKM